MLSAVSLAAADGVPVAPESAPVITFAQEKGDWYVGTGDVANVAWTEWSVSPTIGYGVSENLMVGMSVSQADSTQDMDLDFRLAPAGFSSIMYLGFPKFQKIKGLIYPSPQLIQEWD